MWGSGYSWGGRYSGEQNHSRNKTGSRTCFLYMHFKDIKTAAKRFLDSLKKLRCSEDDSYSSAQAMGFTCRSGAVKVQQVETHRVNQETVTLF